jgi:NADPH:quinone reductase-like Zn-dependent oxidoreductase
MEPVRPPHSLEGSRLLITGAAGGIGILDANGGIKMR